MQTRRPGAAHCDLIYFHEVDKGGHLAAREQPELFAAEFRAAFSSAKGLGDVCQPEQLVSPPRSLTEVSRNAIRFFAPRRAICIPDPCLGRS